MWRSFIILCGLLALWQTAGAQEDYTPYVWEEGGIAFVYPTGWDTPLPAEDDKGATLQLAQAFVQDPLALRPPAITSFSLHVYPTAEQDLGEQLGAALRQYGLEVDGTVADAFLGQRGLLAAAYSADGRFYGMGRAAILPDGRAILFVGRSVADAADAFLRLFTTIEASMVTDTTIAPTPPRYGLRWVAESTALDGEQAFLDVTDIALTPLSEAGAGYLYAVDSFAQVGLVQLDIHNGIVQNQYAIPDGGEAQSIAVDSAGVVYVADSACGCVRGFAGGWQTPLMRDFAAEAPRSLAVTAEGAIYATDMVEGLSVIRVYRAGEERTINFSEALFTQPLLAVDRTNGVWALDEDGALYTLQEADDSFALHSQIALRDAVTDFAFDALNRLVIATDSGVFIYNAQGESVEQIGEAVAAPNFAAAEIYRPRSVAISADNTVYVADSDGTYSRINAFSRGVPYDRVGGLRLVSDVVIGGTLNRDVERHVWLFTGRGGDEIIVSAVDASEQGVVDLALYLYAPSGQEIAANTDYTGEEGALPTLFDAQIAPLVLEADGVYYVAVERQSGEGAYRLALTTTKQGAISDRLRGYLDAAMPRQRWRVNLTANSTIRLTVAAENANLDPMVRLYSPEGVLVAENDDGEAIAPDAELVFSVPTSGVYVVEAARFSGFGPYVLTIAAEGG